jgi:hypothetical protein
VSEVSPGSGVIFQGSGQVGGQCVSDSINSSFTGTITVEVAITTSSGAKATDRASATVVAPKPTDIDHVSASLDRSFYVPGDIAQFCWQATPSGVSIDYEIYVATFFYDSGSDTSGPLRCVGVEIIEEDAEAGHITVEIYVFANGQQYYASASAPVDHPG